MNPAEANPITSRPRGLRLADLVSLVVGYSLASLLARALWPHFDELTGPPVVAFALEILWLGLAIIGPVLLILGHRDLAPRGGSQPSHRRRPERPGRLIAEVPVADRWGTPPALPTVVRNPTSPSPRSDWSRAELAWMAVGGYWIAVTLFLAGARAEGLLAGPPSVIPMVALFGLLALLPTSLRGRRSLAAPRGWTHQVAVGLLWTWPIAWGLLILLGRTL